MIYAKKDGVGICLGRKGGEASWCCTNLKISPGIPFMVWDTGIEGDEAMKDSREGTTCWVRERMTVEELILLLASKASKASKRGIYVQKCKLIKNCKRLGIMVGRVSLLSSAPISSLLLSLLPSSQQSPPPNAADHASVTTNATKGCPAPSCLQKEPVPPFSVPYNTLPGVPLPGLPPIALPGLPPIPVPAVPAVPGLYGTNLSSPLATPPNPAPSNNCVNVVIPLPLFPLPLPVSGVKAIGSAKTSILTSLTALPLTSLLTCPCGVRGGLGLVYAGGGTLRESSEPGGVKFLPSGAGTMSRREKSLRMTACEPAGMMGWEMMLPKEEVEEGVRLRLEEVKVGVGGGRLLRRMRRKATRTAARTATSAPMVMPAMMAAEGVLLLGVGVGSGEAAPLVVGRVGEGGGGGVVVGEGVVEEEEVGGGGGGMDWSLSRTQLSSPAQE